MPNPAPAAGSPPPLRLTLWIEKYRRVWFGLIGLLMVISFNGRWQVGPDSAAYRALGHQLATSGRYFFREKVVGIEDYADQQGTRYPGLPILLAGLEKLFGASDLPPLLLMNALVVVLLMLTYRLMLYRVPRWLAVAVVVGLGTNARFLQYTNEILTDIPFLLGLVITMLGYEQLLRAANDREMAISGGVLLTGLLLAAVMRPTFWFIGIAIVLACVWGLITARVALRFRSGKATDASPGQERVSIQPPSGSVSRWRFAVLLADLTLAAAVFVVALDMRAKSGLGGGYESHVFTRLQKLIRLSPDSAHEMLEDALPVAFFGMKIGSGIIGPKPDPTEEQTRLKRARRTPGGIVEPMRDTRYGLSTIYSVIVIAAGIWLARRNVLWGALVLVTVAAFLLTGAVPRYFIMLLPLLLAGWGLFSYGVARLFPWTVMSNLALLAGLATVVVMNLLVASDFILKQRGITRPVDENGKWVGFHYVGFAAVHHRGIWAGIYDLANMVKNNTQPADKLLGPEATVLTYLSERQVYFPRVAETQREGSSRGAESYFKLALIPNSEEASGFYEYNAVIRDMAASRLITTGRVLAGPVAGYELVEFAVVPPHPRGPRRSRPTATTQLSK